MAQKVTAFGSSSVVAAVGLGQHRYHGLTGTRGGAPSLAKLDVECERD